jgi:hypothetical protein
LGISDFPFPSGSPSVSAKIFSCIGRSDIHTQAYVHFLRSETFISASREKQRRFRLAEPQLMNNIISQRREIQEPSEKFFVETLAIALYNRTI